ncbi:MAG: amidohydrolase family protein [Gammaproteobacteria bacterium]|nr:amidohydrolase family protein [Gammaproteobacteria bacterium]
MADLIKVDSHVHLYRTVEEGLAEKAGYEVWEYGEKPAVCYSEDAGTVDQVIKAMESSGISKAVLLNLFSAQVARDMEIAKLASNLGESQKETAIQEIDHNILGQLKEFNRWGCEVAQNFPEITAFIALDPIALPGEAGATHVSEMVENHGARGVKLHGAFQVFNMSDQRLWPAYRKCEELDVAIIGHSGPDRGGIGFAEPRSFGHMLREFPRLKVVLAHMGGATWKQALEIAETYPNAFFDCCEIIEWTDGTNAPTELELAQLIRDIGAERVMMGSDFPWYDLDHTVERVMELPLLSQEEKEGILGANAITILGL